MGTVMMSIKPGRLLLRVPELFLHASRTNVYAFVRLPGGRAAASANDAVEPVHTMVPHTGTVRSAALVGSLLADRLSVLSIQRVHFGGCTSWTRRVSFRTHVAMLLAIHRRGVNVSIDGTNWQMQNVADRRAVDDALRALRAAGMRVNMATVSLRDRTGGRRKSHIPAAPLDSVRVET